ncbi:hypothetical protein Tco_0528522 [Tanacetum coccineum]
MVATEHHRIQPLVIQKSHDPVKPVGSPISPEPSSPQVDNSPPSKEPSKRPVFISLLGLSMKESLLSNKEKLNEMANTPVSETCSAIILKKLPEKLGDPGQFLIPCNFSELKCKALADLDDLRTSKLLLVIHSPKKASISAISHIFPNNNLEDSFKMGDEDLNFIPNKELDKEDLIPIPRESKIGKECDFPFCDDFQSFKTFSNPLFEKKDDFPSRNDESILKEEVHKETLKSYLNPLFEDNEEIISIEVSRQISPKVNSEPSKEISSICPSIKERLNFWKNKEVLEKNEILKRNNTCDFQTPSFSLGKKEVKGEMNLDAKTMVSFFAPIGNCVRKWATNEFVKDNDEINHEVFKSDNENDLGVHDNEEEEIAFLDGLLENENFFEMNDKKVESLERKTKEDFETKDEPKSKKELQVVHPDIEILNHFEITSYVGSDYVFYEDFNLVDMLFPMNIWGEIFDPGITFHEKPFEKDAFKDKSSKELAPSKSLLTLDVFDPLHPPLIDFHVTKALSGFTFSLLKLFSKKFFEPGIKNATIVESSESPGKNEFSSFVLYYGRKDIKVQKSKNRKPTRSEKQYKRRDLKPISKAESADTRRKESERNNSGQREIRPVWNNTQRINHQNKFVPSAVLTRSRRVPVSAAKQSSFRAATCQPQYVPVFYKSTTPNTRISNEKVNTVRVNGVRVNGVNTAGQTAVSVVKGNGVTAVKASAVCVWRPKMTYLNNVSKDNSGSWVSKRGKSTTSLEENKVILTVGWFKARDMNKDFLNDYHDMMECFVAFVNVLLSSPGNAILYILDLKNVVPSGDVSSFNGFLSNDILVCLSMGISNTGVPVRFSWVFFLASKDETSGILKRFITEIENQFNHKGNKGPNWLFDIDSLTNSMNYQPVTTGNQTNKNAGPQEANEDTGLKKSVDTRQSKEKNVSTQQYIMFPLWSSISSSYKSSDESYKNDTADDVAGEICTKTANDLSCDDWEDTAEVQNTGIFGSAYDDDDLDTYNSPYADQVMGAEADFNNMEPSTIFSPIPTTRVHSIHPKDQIIRDLKSAVQTRGMTKKSSGEHAMIRHPRKQCRANP